VGTPREIDLVRQRPWSRVYRLRRADDVVWLKVPERDFAFEARALELLAPLAPGLFPRVLAAESEAGCLLLADEGEAADVAWPALLTRYARLQRDATPLADALVSAGVEDLRGELLAAAVAEVLPGNARAQELCAVLAESRVPPTVEHRDLRADNVRGGVLLDWGDLGIAHPFLSISWGDPWRNREAYLACWPEDAAAVEAARALRAPWGAVSWRRVRPYDPEVDGRIRELLASF
jgi:hypothetical protein